MYRSVNSKLFYTEKLLLYLFRHENIIINNIMYIILRILYHILINL